MTGSFLIQEFCAFSDSLIDLSIVSSDSLKEFPNASEKDWIPAKKRKKCQKKIFLVSQIWSLAHMCKPMVILMIKGLFWNIREIGNNSSMHILKRLSIVRNLSFIVLTD